MQTREREPFAANFRDRAPGCYSFLAVFYCPMILQMSFDPEKVAGKLFRTNCLVTGYPLAVGRP
jgi:uncharacterized membrane protein (DUF485 family)